jgi:sulfatase modifying factor 1
MGATFFAGHRDVKGNEGSMAPGANFRRASRRARASKLGTTAAAALTLASMAQHIATAAQPSAATPGGAVTEAVTATPPSTAAADALGVAPESGPAAPSSPADSPPQPSPPAASSRPSPPAAVKPSAPVGNPFGLVENAASEAESALETLKVQREKLFSHMALELNLAPAQVARVREIFEASSVLSQGNPSISKHPIGRAECEVARAERPLRSGDDVCGSPHMAALYDRTSGSPDEAPVCVDQFEFPNIPCEYPVVHVSAREASQLCEAVGKRLCDAHEWEGACAGSLDAPEREYAWGQDRMTMRRVHNASRTRVWAYGPEKNHALCATTSFKTPGCPGGGFHSCGSNTFPAGSFPDCVSPYGVYDLHGNAAEHMSLPLTRDELTSSGGSGATEMKGSWFIFSNYEAHEDDCHWRAPDWHPSKVMSLHSHGNYHLGFRCCKSVEEEPAVARAGEPQHCSTPLPNVPDAPVCY